MTSIVQLSLKILYLSTLITVSVDEKTRRASWLATLFMYYTEKGIGFYKSQHPLGAGVKLGLMV